MKDGVVVASFDSRFEVSLRATHQPRRSDSNLPIIPCHGGRVASGGLGESGRPARRGALRFFCLLVENIEQ